MFEAFQKTWQESMEIPEARWIVWATILLIAVLIAAFVAKKFRDMAIGRGSTSTEGMLPDFDRLRREGKLNEEEYKKLKSSFQQQLKEKRLNG